MNNFKRRNVFQKYDFSIMPDWTVTMELYLKKQTYRKRSSTKIVLFVRKLKI